MPATVNAKTVRAVLGVAKAAHLDAGALARAHGLDAAMTDVDARFPHSAWIALWEDILRRTGREALGIEAAEGLSYASGGSEISVDVITDELAIHLSGGSSAISTGSARAAALHASGGSGAHLGELRADTAAVELSGASTGSVTVDHTLDYDLSGGSHLAYFGDPQIGTRETSGGSSAEHGG